MNQYRTAVTTLTLASSENTYRSLELVCSHLQSISATFLTCKRYIAHPIYSHYTFVDDICPRDSHRHSSRAAWSRAELFLTSGHRCMIDSSQVHTKWVKTDLTTTRQSIKSSNMLSASTSILHLNITTQDTCKLGDSTFYNYKEQLLTNMTWLTQRSQNDWGYTMGSTQTH